jgi:RNA polymerase sigma factor for flagellar operon FliA
MGLEKRGMAMKSENGSSKDSGARRQARAKSQKRRSDILDQRPERKRVASPVNAPLIFHKTQAEQPTDSHQRRTARDAKRRLESGLWNAWFKDRDEDARNALWVHYQGLVRYIADRQKTKLPDCIDVQDLVSAGNMGLLDAINKFDPTKGTRFETYCVPRIRGSMVDSIRAADWVPRLIRNKGHQYDRIVAELATELGREPSDEEVAKRLDIDLGELERLRGELDVKAQISFEGAADGADERDLLRLEMLADEDDIEPTQDLQREEIRNMALRGLQHAERWVVEQYYFHNRSMKQIGDDLNLSESRICQIHSQVIELLKRKFRAYEESCEL